MTKISYVFWLLCLVLLVFFPGCDCRRNEIASNPLYNENVDMDRTRRQKEIFDSSLELLGSLEDNPCLPGTKDAEKLISTADRLNKWIQGRAADEFWKPDADLLEIESATTRTAQTAAEVVRLIRIIQGETDESGTPSSLPDSLEEERKKTVELLGQLETDLKNLAEKSGIGDFTVFIKQVVDLQKKFAGLATIKNISAKDIRAFARQLGGDISRFNNVSENLNRFAEELRIEGLFIHLADVEYMKQSLWARDVSNWARGEKHVLIERVFHLFDWTVCNIDLRDRTMPIDSQRVIETPQQYPWQSMLLGSSTLWDRIWVFVELLRQQRIDACLLGVPHPEQPEFPLIWAVGVLLEGEIYIFLPAYGMPLPGPAGPALGENGALEFPEIATLSQVQKDDTLLRRCDFSEQNRFPVTAEMLKNTTAYLIATPESASMRMKVLETELSGDQNMVLYTNSQEQRRLFSEVAGIEKVEIWRYPFKTKFEQLLMTEVTTQLMSVFLFPNPKRQNYPLWTGRILYFKGKVSGQESAITNFQDARIPDRAIMEYRDSAEFRNNPIQEVILRMVNLNASFWLGLSSFEVDSIPAARDFFAGLGSTGRNPWRNASEYMLGRIAERQRQYDEALKHYGNVKTGPASLGNTLRAKWLQEKTATP